MLGDRKFPLVCLALICLVCPSVAQGQWWKKATDGSIDPFNRKNDLGSYIDVNKISNINVTPSYQTNKFDLKAKVEGGGWHVAWADDIAERDAVQGVVAAGVSVLSENPGPFLAWVQLLVDRTVDSLQRSGREIPREVEVEIRNLAARVISEAIRGESSKEVFRDFNGFGVKAGAIRYSGANKLGDTVVSRTWGIKPYIAVRIAKPQGGFVPPPERRGGPGRGAVREIFRGRESGYVFEHAIDGRWIARQPNGTIVADFEEVERTDEFVGLKSHNNFPHIKLFADHSEEFFPHESKQWKAVERGEWMQRR